MIKTYSRHVKPKDMAYFRRAWKIDDNHYRVYSRDGEPYILFVYWDSKGKVHILCPCPAGSHNNPCFHGTILLKRLDREGLSG
jgi:hypothetical protein